MWGVLSVVTMLCELTLSICSFVIPWRIYQLAIHKRIGYTLGESTFLFMVVVFLAFGMQFFIEGLSVLWPQDLKVAVMIAHIMSAICIVPLTMQLYSNAARILSNHHQLAESMRRLEKVLEDTEDTEHEQSISASSIH